MIALTIAVSITSFALPSYASSVKTQASDVSVDSGIIDAINSQGSVDVIVSLKNYTTNDLNSTTKRSELSSDQNEIVDDADLNKSETVKYSRIPSMATNVDLNQLEQLKQNPNVETIKLQNFYTPSSDLIRPSLTQAVSILGADSAWNNSTSYTGVGSKIAIIDTGVQSSHPFLSGAVTTEACFAQGPDGIGGSGSCPNNLDSQTGSGAGAPCATTSGCGHGTHVAGIAAGRRSVSGAPTGGIAPSATIMAIQVFSTYTNANLDSQGNPICSSVGAASPCILTSDSDVLSALNYVLSHRTGVVSVNMSLGGGAYSTNCDADSPDEADAISQLRSYGILTVVASGNDGSSSNISWPACISKAVAVGATTKSDVVANYSNSNSMLSLWAPGSSIKSSVPSSLDINDGTVDGYEIKSGTSMATPMISGAVALLRQAYPNESSIQILTRLKSSGLDIKDSRNGITRKRPSIIQAIQMASPTNAELVRTVSNSSVYLINGDTKYPITNIGVFNDFSTLGPVRFVEKSYLDSIPTGSNLSRVIGSTADSNVYLIIAGIKLLFPSCDLVVDFGYSCSNLILFSPDTLNRFVNGPAVTVYFRSVTDATVYFIDNGYKRPIASWPDLVSLGYPIAIHRFSDLFLNSIATGDTMLGGGSLVKVSNSASVYVVNNWSGSPSLFPVTSFANTVDLGLGTSVRTISPSEFSKYSIGSNLRTTIKCGSNTYVGTNGVLYRVDSTLYSNFGYTLSSFLDGGEICNRFNFSQNDLSKYIVNSGSIYLAENGVKKGFTSYSAFLSNGGGSSTPTFISNTMANSIPNGPVISS
ncbi:MAG: S8 family serine peptidase [Acidimicrobiia bacterium]